MKNLLLLVSALILIMQADLRADKAFAWGYNWNGLLGLGDTARRYEPTEIISSNEWKQIQANSNHTLALKTDGTLWAWGSNSNGEVGDGTTTHRLYPVQIGFEKNWKLLSSGWNNSLAIKNDNSLWLGEIMIMAK